jgi:hypothetical protein
MMCFKKKPERIFDPVHARVLSFTINDYPGGIPDLNGCDPDGKQVKDTVLSFWPDTDVRRYRENKATLENFRFATAQSIKSLSPGAVVCVLADSCFSGTITRHDPPILDNPGSGLVNPFPTRNRFYATPGVEIIKQVRPFATARGDLRWIVISGCGETQYSADAYINGSYHGAFSWYAFNLLRPGMTYRQWYIEIIKYLPGTNFEQAPTLEGPDYMLDRVIFEDQTLWIHNSSHGTQLPGISGDEPIDEAICLYNGNLRDNEYNAILSKIPF